jgi:hypothetical protein
MSSHVYKINKYKEASMPTLQKKSVEYYQEQIRNNHIEIFHSPILKGLLPGIDTKLLTQCKSLSALLSHDSCPVIPCNAANIIMFISISCMMKDYVREVDSFSLKSKIDLFFNNRGRPQYQRELANYVMDMMSKYQIELRIRSEMRLQLPPAETQNSFRERVISKLEEGLLAEHLSPEDNFPLIVKAIALEASCLADFVFSERAIAAMHLIDLNAETLTQTVGVFQSR